MGGKAKSLSRTLSAGGVIDCVVDFSECESAAFEGLDAATAVNRRLRKELVAGWCDLGRCDQADLQPMPNRRHGRARAFGQLADFDFEECFAGWSVVIHTVPGAASRSIKVDVKRAIDARRMRLS